MGSDSVILVTGGDGQVGRALRRLEPGARFATRHELDVTNADAVAASVSGVDVVIHAAALTNVDACELDPDRAFAVNALGTRRVVEAAAESGARVIYLSTDYVFDGLKPTEYVESDPTNPLNVYGRSKLEGEGYVLAGDANLVVRTSWVIGEGRNFVRSILAAATNTDRLQVVDDQRGRPTVALDLASALLVLARASSAGIVHVCGDGPPCSWADLAEEALSAAGMSRTVQRVDSATYERTAGRPIAPRPANSTLSVENARSKDVPLRDWRRSLREYVEALA